MPRERIVADGVHEEIWVDNHNDAAAELELRLCFATDVADLPEIRYQRTRSRTAPPCSGCERSWP